MFKYDNDIRNSLKIIRSKLPKMFHYEDCAILVKDKLEGDSFYAVSPNVSCNQLPHLKKSDLFFYNPKKSLTTDVYESCQTAYYENPRDEPLFVEGIDNLTPVN